MLGKKHVGESLPNLTCLDSSMSVTDWILQNPDAKDLLIGYFGASTAIAAAIVVLLKGLILLQKPSFILII